MRSALRRRRTMMSGIVRKRSAWAVWLFAAMLFLSGSRVQAAVDGISGTTFDLVAKQDFILTGDGDSFLMWGYAVGTGRAQYPGPTLILNQEDDITINLTNQLPVEAGNVSIMFPGFEVTASGGVDGLLTKEAPPGGTVTYTFRANKPGTYLYRSGTRPDLQVEMGLVGAIIVRPSGFNAADPEKRKAYNHENTQYDREVLYLITEMDPRIHRQVEFGQWDQIDTSSYFATNWFINGRNFPDIMADPHVPWLPTQPYNCQTLMHPGEKVLIRMIGAGRDLHPMHYHGNDFETIAIDASVLSSTGGDPDLAWKDNTMKSVPGQTADMIWTWTGEKLGWDIYGHKGDEVHQSGPGAGIPICRDRDGDFDRYNNEYCPDHGKPFPVILPERQGLTYGAFYSGSPFLGGTGALTPGDQGLNSTGAFLFMWHSHTEKELTSNDLWPGGLVSFVIILHPDVPIP
jgi:FtsP/CotA-like multicopper oxidase with cupredoxin domain